jgi:superfamily II DNA or RNA helicase
MILRPYQSAIRDQVVANWKAGVNDQCVVAPTGSGKTVIFSSLVQSHSTPGVAIAHRTELVSQMALAFARNEVRHKIIGPKETVKECINIQLAELGTSYYSPSADCAVIGVDTLIRREEETRSWRKRVGLVIMDEGHHLLRGNKWGTAREMLGHARMVGFTATPCRADKKGLGKHADGFYTTIVEGPGMRDLISQGYLTDYRIFCPAGDFDMGSINPGASGDWSTPALRKAAKRSHIVGDVVQEYIKIANGKLGVTFASDVETATEIAAEYRARGVPAEVVSAKTPTPVRMEILRRFRRRELVQLVNVDLFGEGFDLPAVEVVSMARPTCSYALYCQQFGRALRLMEGKDWALIIDHVGNIVRHGLPDRPRVWTLDRGESTPRMKNPDDDVPLRYCPECTSPFEKCLPACPICGWHVVPGRRGSPEMVEGDLAEVDPEMLKMLRGEKAWVDTPVDTVYDWAKQSKPGPIAKAIANKHGDRQEYQAVLRANIAWWAGFQAAKGRSDSESYKRFYHSFGIDVLTAQTLGKNEALALANKIAEFLARAT